MTAEKHKLTCDEDTGDYVYREWTIRDYRHTGYSGGRWSVSMGTRLFPTLKAAKAYIDRRITEKKQASEQQQ